MGECSLQNGCLVHSPQTTVQGRVPKVVANQTMDCHISPISPFLPLKGLRALRPLNNAFPPRLVALCLDPTLRATVIFYTATGSLFLPFSPTIKLALMWSDLATRRAPFGSTGSPSLMSRMLEMNSGGIISWPYCTVYTHAVFLWKEPGGAKTAANVKRVVM